MSCAAAAISVSRAGPWPPSTRPLEQAHGGRGREVQRLGAAVLRHADGGVGRGAITSGARPWASLPNTKATGPVEVGRVQALRAVARPSRGRGTRRPRSARIASASVTSRTTGTWKTEPGRGADRLRVVDVDAGAREHDAAPRPRRRPTAARSRRSPGRAPRAGSRRTPRPASSSSGHVEVGRDPDDGLRRHGRGDAAASPSSPTCEHRHARLRRPRIASGSQRVGREQLGERGRRLGERLADALGALDEEAPRPRRGSARLRSRVAARTFGSAAAHAGRRASATSRHGV